MTPVRARIYVQHPRPHLVITIDAQPPATLEQRLEIGGRRIADDGTHIDTMPSACEGWTRWAVLLPRRRSSEFFGRLLPYATPFFTT